MRLLLISTYELGRQPVHVASPVARLRAAGYEVVVVDTAITPLQDAVIGGADAVAISVPMHTALRLAEAVVESVRRIAPEMPIALYGLYAGVSTDAGAHRIAGEYEDGLVAWAEAVAAGQAPRGVVTDRSRQRFLVPDRSGLPPLTAYARLAVDGVERVVGAVEASHGCLHRCRHCPLPVVYDGRMRIVDPEVVLADIARLAAAGAEHITFGDPDFLNGPQHALRIVREMRAAFPDITYDLTTKVEHILRHAALWPDLAPGLQFVVSAFETTNDRILGLLDKGHTAEDMAEAVHLLRGHGVEIRPSWMPFTPWTTVGDLADIVAFLARHDLVANTDPVQLSIRLLIPEGSLLLQAPEMRPHLGVHDPAALSWTWTPRHPETDDLQRTLADLAAGGADAGRDPFDTMAAMWAAIAAAAGVDPDTIPLGATVGRPRMTEPWFC